MRARPLIRGIFFVLSAAIAQRVFAECSEQALRQTAQSLRDLNAALEPLKGKVDFDVEAVQKGLIAEYNQEVRKCKGETADAELEKLEEGLIAPALETLRPGAQAWEEYVRRNPDAEKFLPQTVEKPAGTPVADGTPGTEKKPPFRYLTQGELTALLDKITPAERQELLQLPEGAQHLRKWELALKYGVADPNLKVEKLPITDADKPALSAFYNMGAYSSAKDAVLQDVARLMMDAPSRFEKAILSGHSPLIAPGRQEYVISLGAGHGSKIVFDALAAYYQRHGDSGKVIFRTTERQMDWTRSTFPNEYSHQISRERIGVPIEYYGVPGSHIYAYRMLGPNRDDVSNYAVITNSPLVFRQSFSTNEVRQSTVDNHWSVQKQYADDIMEVLSESGAPGITVSRDWNQYSHLITVTAPKLYR